MRDKPQRNGKRVSVVIPTYNRSSQLVEAVDSVLAQTMPPSEVIIVDDGSIDETPDIFAKAAAPIKYLRILNSGVSAARNVGVRAATGDWISFLDSDDKWHPTKLERQFQCIERTKASVCFTGCAVGSRVELDLQKIDPEIRPGEERYYSKPYDLFVRHRTHPLLPSLLVSREALNRTGLFDESLCAAEDTKLIYQLAFMYGLAYVNEALVTVCRKRSTPGLSDNMEPRTAARRYDCSIRVLSEVYWRLLELDRDAARAVKKALGYFISRRAELACIMGERLLFSLAVEGVFASRDWKSLRRCLALALFPSACRRRVKEKWVQSGLPV